MTNKLDSIGASYSFISQNITINLAEEILLRLQGKVDYTDYADSLLYGKYVHELVHFYQNITTTYGLWKTLMLRSAGHMLHHGILLYENEVPLAKYPINDSMREVIPDNLESYEFFARGKTMHFAINMMEHRYKHPVDENFIGCNKPKGATTPHVTYNGTNYGITTGYLLEYQAYTQQLFTLDHLKGVPKEHVDKIATGIEKSIYFKLILALIADVFNVKKVGNIAHYTAYELITLSLNPNFPENPLNVFKSFASEGKINNDLVNWEDIHPGWRFYTIMSHIKSQKMSLPESMKAIPQFIEEVRNSLGWNNEKEIVKDFYNKIKNKLIMQDILSLKLAVEEAYDKYDMSIFIHTEECLREASKSIVGTPLPYNNLNDKDKNMNAIYDIATQKFFSDIVICPLCKQIDSHRQGCAVPAYENIIIKATIKSKKV